MLDQSTILVLASLILARNWSGYHLAIDQLIASPATALPVSLVNRPIILRGTINFRTVGASGLVTARAEVGLNTSGTTWASIAGVTPTPVAIDTTLNNLFDITAQWGAASASNTLSIVGGVILPA